MHVPAGFVRVPFRVRPSACVSWRFVFRGLRGCLLLAWVSRVMAEEQERELLASMLGGDDVEGVDGVGGAGPGGRSNLYSQQMGGPGYYSFPVAAHAAVTRHL